MTRGDDWDQLRLSLLGLCGCGEAGDPFGYPWRWGIKSIHSFAHSFVPSDNLVLSFCPVLQEVLNFPEAWSAGLRANQSESHFLCPPRRWALRPWPVVLSRHPSPPSLLHILHPTGGSRMAGVTQATTLATRPQLLPLGSSTAWPSSLGVLGLRSCTSSLSGPLSWWCDQVSSF